MKGKRHILRIGALFALVALLATGFARTPDVPASELPAWFVTHLALAKIRLGILDLRSVEAGLIHMVARGSTLYVSGFVQSTADADHVEALISRSSRFTNVETRWQVVHDLNHRPTYTTYVGERLADARTLMQVRTWLHRNQAERLPHMRTIGTRVRCGDVDLFVLTTEAPPPSKEMPRPTDIHGVSTVWVHTLTVPREAI